MRDDLLQGHVSRPRARLTMPCQEAGKDCHCSCCLHIAPSLPPLVCGAPTPLCMETKRNHPAPQSAASRTERPALPPPRDRAARPMSAFRRDQFRQIPQVYLFMKTLFMTITAILAFTTLQASESSPSCSTDTAACCVSSCCCLTGGCCDDCPTCCLMGDCCESGCWAAGCCECSAD